MKFLIDAQLPPALARWLQEASHEAVHVEDPRHVVNAERRTQLAYPFATRLCTGECPANTCEKTGLGGWGPVTPSACYQIRLETDH